MSSKQQVGAFWKRFGKQSGKEFYSGKLEVDGRELEVVMFPNSYKTKENKQPDLIVYEQENERNYQQNNVNDAVETSSNDVSSDRIEYPEDDINVEDIPF